MYVVTKRFGRNETRVDTFSKEMDAVNFIYEKLREDITFKVNATYCLYEGMDLLREYSQADIPDSPASSAADSSAQGAGQRSSFRPSPLNTAPRPPGMPQHWQKDEDTKK